MKFRSMRKTLPLLAVILFLVSQGCASNSSGDGDTGFVDPGLGDAAAAEDVAATSYSLNVDSCSSGHCAAVIFDTEISHTTYSGFAVRNTQNSGVGDLFLKVYWEGDLPGSFSNCPVTAKLLRSNGVYCESSSAALTATFGAVSATDGSQTISGIILAIPSCTTVTGSITAHRY